MTLKTIKSASDVCIARELIKQGIDLKFYLERPTMLKALIADMDGTYQVEVSTGQPAFMLRLNLDQINRVVSLIEILTS